jgi:hypothetical protein
MRVVPVTGLCVAVTVFQTYLQKYLPNTRVLYSNVTVVEEPLELTVPFNVALVEEIFVASDVAATGT